MRSRTLRFLAVSALMALALAMFGATPSAHAADPSSTFSGYKDYIRFKTTDATPAVLREGRLVVTTSGTGPKAFLDVDGATRKITFSTSSGGTANDTLNINFAIGVISVKVAGCDFSTTECLASALTGTWTATGGKLAKLGYTSGAYEASIADPKRYKFTNFTASIVSGAGVLSGNLRDLKQGDGTGCNVLIVDPFGTIIADSDAPGRNNSNLCLKYVSATGVETKVVKQPVAGTFDTTNGWLGALRARDKGHFAVFTKSVTATSYSGNIVRATDVTNPTIGTWSATITPV